MDRFWNKVKKTRSCWLWTGAEKGQGYGYFSFNGKDWRAHRFSYLLNIDEIPKGMCVLHTCDNRRCVRPSHLKLGTHAENMMDMAKKGRGTAKLDTPAARAIKESLKDDQPKAQIARRFGISRSTVRDISQGKYWRHV